MTAAPIVVVPETPENYLTVEYGVRSWLLTTDHKRVGLLYLMAITGAFFVGGSGDNLLGTCGGANHGPGVRAALGNWSTRISKLTP